MVKGRAVFEFMTLRRIYSKFVHFQQSAQIMGSEQMFIH